MQVGLQRGPAVDAGASARAHTEGVHPVVGVPTPCRSVQPCGVRRRGGADAVHPCGAVPRRHDVHPLPNDNHSRRNAGACVGGNAEVRGCTVCMDAGIAGEAGEYGWHLAQRRECMVAVG